MAFATRVSRFGLLVRRWYGTGRRPVKGAGLSCRGGCDGRVSVGRGGLVALAGLGGPEPLCGQGLFQQEDGHLRKAAALLVGQPLQRMADPVIGAERHEGMPVPVAVGEIGLPLLPARLGTVAAAAKGNAAFDGVQRAGNDAVDIEFPGVHLLVLFAGHSALCAAKPVAFTDGFLDGEDSRLTLSGLQACPSSPPPSAGGHSPCRFSSSIINRRSSRLMDRSFRSASFENCSYTSRGTLTILWGRCLSFFGPGLPGFFFFAMTAIVISPCLHGNTSRQPLVAALYARIILGLW